MAACRRALAVLLFLLLCSAGMLAPVGTGERGDEVTRGVEVVSASWRPESHARQARGRAGNPTKRADDSGALASGGALDDQVLLEPFEPRLGGCAGHLPRVGGPLAGRPRGPPRAA